jgi:hypothetical protein
MPESRMCGVTTAAHGLRHSDLPNDSNETGWRAWKRVVIVASQTKPVSTADWRRPDATWATNEGVEEFRG